MSKLLDSVSINFRSFLSCCALWAVRLIAALTGGIIDTAGVCSQLP